MKRRHRAAIYMESIMNKFFDVLCNICERLMLSAFIILAMTFLPIAWSTMIYCSGGFMAESVAVMLFVGSVFFIYCFLRLMWVDIPLTDSTALIF